MMSRRLTTPTTRPLSTTGRLFTAVLVISSAAFASSVSLVTVIGWVLMTSTTREWNGGAVSRTGISCARWSGTTISRMTSASLTTPTMFPERSSTGMAAIVCRSSSSIASFTVALS